MLCYSTWECVPALGAGCPAWPVMVAHEGGDGAWSSLGRKQGNVENSSRSCKLSHRLIPLCWQRERLHSVLLGMAATTHSIISTAYGVVCHHLYTFLCNHLFRNMCRIQKESEEYAGALDSLQIKMIGNGQIRVKHNLQPVKESLCWTGTSQNPGWLNSSCILNTGLLCFIHVRFPQLTYLLGSVVSTAHIIYLDFMHDLRTSLMQTAHPLFIKPFCQGRSITGI